MSRARVIGSLAVMAVLIFIGGRIATAAFPLQQSGAKTPGVVTAAPKLTPSKLGAFTYENASLRAILSAFSTMSGIAVTTEVPDRVLDQPITMKFAAGVSPEHVLGFIANVIGGTYRVTSERSVVLTGSTMLSEAAQTPGSRTGAARPGMTTGAGVGSGSGGGIAGGVPGGVSGGVGGGIGGGVAGGVPGGIAGGVAGGAGSGFGSGLGERTVLSPGGQPAAFDTAGFFAGSVGTGTSNPVTRVLPSVPGATGAAKVYVTIDSTGRVQRADFVVAAGDLVVPAVEVAKLWVFEPSALPERQTVIAFNFDAAAAAAEGPILRVGGDIPVPTKVRDVKPVYPQEAIASRIQGVQILEITIDPSGNVLDARALRGQRVLVGPAMDAVLQWKFTPWDRPERRLMTVTVNFTLGGGSGAGAAPARDASADLQAGMAANPGVPYGAATDWPADAVRVGGSIRPPAKVVDVKAVYPKVAQDARVQGVVILDVLIGADGKVKDARILRSIPLLDQAAYDAVLQWEFTPTLLNGTRIPITMTVTVNFTLS